MRSTIVTIATVAQANTHIAKGNATQSAGAMPCWSSTVAEPSVVSGTRLSSTGLRANTTPTATAAADSAIVTMNGSWVGEPANCAKSAEVTGPQPNPALSATPASTDPDPPPRSALHA